MKKILGNGVEPKCRYCRFGTPVTDSDAVLCPKCGVRDGSAACKKFRYDPLKRVPRQPPEMLVFSEDEFSLDLEEV
jgi:hypothetical protein